MRMKSRILTFLAGTFLVGLCLSATASAAVSEQAIYTFIGGSTAADPLTKLVYRSGKFYGASTNGGAECKCGTVYELAPNGDGGWTYHTLYEFKGGSDGLVPVGNIVFDAAGNLYGVTGSGGAQGFGTVYELSLTGGKWAHTVIWYFGEANNDGNSPDAGLLMDSKGNLYGTTFSGGSHFAGTVYELSLGSNGLWNETFLFDFDGTNGYAPEAELIMDAKGNLYGTTFSGGTDSDGVVFELSPDSGGFSETVLYSFTDGADGAQPQAPVWMDSEGNLYGTTIFAPGGAGTVFELTPSAGGSWTETTLHTFGLEFTDGSTPAGGLTSDGKGHLYGTTSQGGEDYAGTVYRLTRGSDGSWSYHLYYTFPSGSSGGNPSTPVTFGAAGNIFGATIGGPDNGATGASVAYEITP
jgi:uncharacterized repeat protein (TIGR03803 family)